jgi:hypothetical protein
MIKDALRTRGYQIVRCSPSAPSKDYEVVGFAPEAIFNAFPWWISKFEINGRAYGGHADYTTTRISVLNEDALHQLVDFSGKTIIEFGPLEGGNTAILERLGAKQITAIEGHRENYIRCCVIKNLFRLDRSTFYLGDATAATVEIYGRHDIAFVAGLLYHLDQPHVFLSRVHAIADTMILSTHYADAESPARDAVLKEIHCQGKTYRGKQFNEDLGPNAGLQAVSFWPFREDLMNMLADAGYGDIRVISDSTDKGTRYKLIYLVARTGAGEK